MQSDTLRKTLRKAEKPASRFARLFGRASIRMDFFIAAQAAVMQLPLLTRDAGRYRSDFPSVELIAP